MCKFANSLTFAVVFTLLAAIPGLASSAESSLLLGGRGWESFAAQPGMASFAWAGEDEGFYATAGLSGSARLQVELDESEADPALLTGIAAPEPPALVLAGLAFGGVVCGRSLVMRRRMASGQSMVDGEKARA